MIVINHWVLPFFICGLGVANANWVKNINYRSPSEHHPSLGISIRKVVKRNDLSSPGWDSAQLNFTQYVYYYYMNFLLQEQLQVV